MRTIVFDTVRIEQHPGDKMWVIEPEHVGWAESSKREALRRAVEDIPGPDMRFGSDPRFVLVDARGGTETYTYDEVTTLMSRRHGDDELQYTALDPDFDFS